MQLLFRWKKLYPLGKTSLLLPNRHFSYSIRKNSYPVGKTRKNIILLKFVFPYRKILRRNFIPAPIRWASLLLVSVPGLSCTLYHSGLGGLVPSCPLSTVQFLDIIQCHASRKQREKRRKKKRRHSVKPEEIKVKQPESWRSCRQQCPARVDIGSLRSEKWYNYNSGSSEFRYKNWNKNFEIEWNLIGLYKSAGR